MRNSIYEQPKQQQQLLREDKNDASKDNKIKHNIVTRDTSQSHYNTNFHDGLLSQHTNKDCDMIFNHNSLKNNHDTEMKFNDENKRSNSIPLATSSATETLTSIKKLHMETPVKPSVINYLSYSDNNALLTTGIKEKTVVEHNITKPVNRIHQIASKLFKKSIK